MSSCMPMWWRQCSGGANTDVPPQHRPASQPHEPVAQALQRMRDAHDTLAKRAAHLRRRARDPLVKLLEAKFRLQQAGTAARHASQDVRNTVRVSLRRRNMWLRSAEQMEGVMMTLESQMLALENSVLLQQTSAAMRGGVDAAQSMQLCVDSVDELLQQIAEQSDTANEVSDALAGGGGSSNVLDDEHLLAELDALIDGETLERELGMDEVHARAMFDESRQLDERLAHVYLPTATVAQPPTATVAQPPTATVAQPLPSAKRIGVEELDTRAARAAATAAHV